MDRLARKSTLRFASAFLLVVAAAFPQSLPTIKDWTAMSPAEKVAWSNLKTAWIPDSMNPETRAEAEQANRDALAALAAGDHATSIKLLSRINTLLRRQEWTPQREFSAALTADLDRSVAAPGERVKVHLGQLFALDQKGPVQITISLQEAASGGARPRQTELKSVEAASVDWMRSPTDVEVELPNAACLNCRISVVLSDPPLQRAIPIRVQPGLAELDQRIAAMAGRIAAVESKGGAGDVVAPIQYRLSLREQAAYNEAESALVALEGGANPWAMRHGDFRMAYRSPVDRTLQPYRLFVPTAYDGSKPFPLIVALHGTGRDENFYFDSVQDGQLKIFAEKRGYIVACPRGRDPLSLYVGDGEQDVLDVLAQVRAIFKVDPARIYLAGHSEGGAGTYSIAIDYPDTFAALAATAPAFFFLTPEDMAKCKATPQMVVQGDQDTQVPVKQTRRFTEAARQAGARVKYLEMAGAGHMDVIAPSLADMFDWFDANRRVAP